MLTIDGSAGEGGGQILRTALALSLVTGTPFRLENIRANRRRPGLRRQHLAAARAVEALGATVEGAELGARTLVVRPGPVRGGEHSFSVGSAGSTCLVLQTVLPPLLASGKAARLTLEGGTHNPLAPPYDFLERVFVPLLARMGARVRLELLRRGFYPAGGGSFRVEVEAGSTLRPLELLERGELVSRRALAIVAHLPADIARRELAVVRAQLGWSDAEFAVEQDEASPGPGNILLLEVSSEHARELCTGFGQRGIRAETVARRAIDDLRHYLASGAPVGVHLADQLMVPLAMAGGGTFRTLPLSGHSRTNLEVVRAFLPVRVEVRESGGQAIVEIARRP
jgi:RNA 3'-terminal phosphate cyclase (ATP)